MEKEKLIWQNLKPSLHRNWDKQGFTSLTDVQLESLPHILEGSDVIVESPTGTGKTLAYVLPLLTNIITEEPHVQAIILAPTRELVMQIQQVLTIFREDSEVRIQALIGGADIKRQIEKLKTRPHIIVGTPGRILELIRGGKLKVHLTKSIIVDEADQMFYDGFVDSVKAIIDRTRKDRQLLFFSATIPKHTEEIGLEIMVNPKLVRISKHARSSSLVDHLYIEAEKRDKIDVLRKLMHTPNFRKAIVFVAESKKFAEMVSKLQYKGLELVYLHTSSSKFDRESAVRQFEQNLAPLLITTDVTSRGMDFSDVSHVIHFDLPDDSEKYIHRSGRTGRMGNKGTVISIVSSYEVKKLIDIAKKARVYVYQRWMSHGELVDVNPISKKEGKAPQKKSNTIKPRRKG